MVRISIMNDDVNGRPNQEIGAQQPQQALLPRQTRAIVLSFIINMNRATSQLYFLAQERNWEDFEQVAKQYAKDKNWRDGNAWVVLQEACKYCPPITAIEPILNDRQNISSLSDLYGRTPLHTACKFGASLSIIEALLKNSVAGVLKESSFVHGSFTASRPVDYVYYFYAKKPKETTHQFVRTLEEACSVDFLDRFELNLFWKKTALLYMAMEYGFDGITEATHRRYNDPVIVFKVYGSMLKHGCVSVDVERFITRIIDNFISRANVILKPDDRLLINVLAEGNVGWDDGLQLVSNSAPLSLCTRDPKTGLLPFMIAAKLATYAINDIVHVETIYKLLSKDPEAIRLGLEESSLT